MRYGLVDNLKKLVVNVGDHDEKPADIEGHSWVQHDDVLTGWHYDAQTGVVHPEGQPPVQLPPIAAETPQVEEKAEGEGDHANKTGGEGHDADATGSN